MRAAQNHSLSIIHFHVYRDDAWALTYTELHHVSKQSQEWTGELTYTMRSFIIRTQQQLLLGI